MNGFNSADYNSAQYNTAQFNTAEPAPSFGNVDTGMPANTAYPQPPPPYQQTVQITMVRKVRIFRNLLHEKFIEVDRTEH